MKCGEIPTLQKKKMKLQISVHPIGLYSHTSALAATTVPPSNNVIKYRNEQIDIES